MEYGTGKQLAENYRANDVWTWLFFNPESWVAKYMDLTQQMKRL